MAQYVVNHFYPVAFDRTRLRCESDWTS